LLRYSVVPTLPSPSFFSFLSSARTRKKEGDGSICCHHLLIIVVLLRCAML
jgi:hypothetical protein